jgi:hypothetical protein
VLGGFGGVMLAVELKIGKAAGMLSTYDLSAYVGANFRSMPI